MEAETESTAVHGTLHHVELWVPDLSRAVRSFGWLLSELGYQPYQDWPDGRSWRSQQGIECAQQLCHTLVPLVGLRMVDDRGAIPILVKCGVQSLLQGRGVAERHDAAERVTADHFCVATHIGGHDGQATGHGLEKHVRPAFVAGGQHEHIGSRQRPFEHVGRQRAEEMHASAQSQPSDLLRRDGSRA